MPKILTASENISCMVDFKTAIIDFEDELKLQHAQFNLFRRVWENTAELPESVTMDDLKDISTRMTHTHELLVLIKNGLINEQSSLTRFTYV